MVDGICWSKGIQGVTYTGPDGRKFCAIEDPTAKESKAYPLEDTCSLPPQPEQIPIETGPTLAALRPAPAKAAATPKKEAVAAKADDCGWMQALLVGCPTGGAVACSPTIDYEACPNGVDPVVYGAPTVSKTVVDQNVAVKVTASQETLADCSGEFNPDLEVSFVANDGTRVEALYNEETGVYEAEMVFTTAGDKQIFIEVRDPGQANGKTIKGYSGASIYVKSADITIGVDCGEPSAPQYIIGQPSEITEAALAGGVTVTWQSESPMLNCDGSTSAIKLVAHFGDGDVEIVPDENGRVKLVKTLTTANFPNSEISCDLVYVDPADGQEKVKYGYTKLYPPTVIAGIDPVGACEYSSNPQIIGELEVSPEAAQLIVGQEVTIAIPKTAVLQCDGLSGADQDNTLVVQFLVQNEIITASQDEDYYYVTTTYAEAGDKTVTLLVNDANPDLPQTPSQQTKSIGFYVKADEVATSCGKPTYPDYILPTPESVAEADLPGGVAVTWNPESPITNCDGTTAGLSLIAHFADGDVVYSPDAEGKFAITKTLTSKLTSPVKCDVIYLDALSGETKVIPNAITLYSPAYTTISDIEPTACELVNDIPAAGSLSVASPNINPANQIVVGEEMTFTLSQVADCDLGEADLEVTLFYGDQTYPMAADGSGNYSASVLATLAGPPVIAEVLDKTRGTKTQRQLWDLPSVISSQVAACQTNPNPQITGVPQIDDADGQAQLGEVITVTMGAANFKNCAGETSPELQVSFYAEDGASLVEIPAVLDEATQSYSAQFAFASTGAKKIYARVTDPAQPESVMVESYSGADIYIVPEEVVGPTACEVAQDLPSAGALSADVSQAIAGEPITFTLTNVKDCNFAEDQTADVTVTLFFGNSSMVMANDGSGNYTAVVEAGTWGMPVMAEIYDNERGTYVMREFWGPLTVLPAQIETCDVNPQPIVFNVVGPNPSGNYDIDSGLPVTWEINAENCDGTPNVAAVCHFGPIGDVYAEADANGTIIVSTPLTQQLSGKVPCDLIGANGEVSVNAVMLDLPWYTTGEPIANLLAYPNSGPAPLVVTLDASTSHPTAPGATIVQYEWDLGDGTPPFTTNEPTIFHEFNCGDGTCTLHPTVRVYDSYGNVSIANVTISTWKQ